MDLPDVAPGAIVYFPVHHKDAYLYLGDCHGTQGDGELCGVAVEIASTTTVQVDLIKGWSIAWPRLENERFIMTIGSTRPMEDAARIAYRELIRWLVADYGWDKLEAYFFLTQAGRVRLGNMVDPKYTSSSSPLRTAIASPPPKELGGIEFRADELEVGAQLGIEESRATGQLIGDDEVQSTQREVDEQLVTVGVAPDGGNAAIGGSGIVRGVPMDADRLAVQCLRRQVLRHAAQADRPVATAEVGLGEIDELLAVGGDRHRRHDEVDYPVLQLLDRLAEVRPDQRAADLHLLAQGTGDVDVEAAKSAILVEHGKGRRCRLDADPQLTPLQGDCWNGRLQQPCDGEQQECTHRSAADPLTAGTEPAQGCRELGQGGLGCLARCSTARTVVATAWLTAS